jgi:hypothetical protein
MAWRYRACMDNRDKQKLNFAIEIHSLSYNVLLADRSLEVMDHIHMGSARRAARKFAYKLTFKPCKGCLCA